MDPAVTLTTMRNEDLDLEDRIDAARVLLGWINSGGFLPYNLGYKVGGNGFAKQMAINECNRLINMKATSMATLPRWEGR